MSPTTGDSGEHFRRSEKRCSVTLGYFRIIHAFLFSISDRTARLLECLLLVRRFQQENANSRLEQQSSRILSKCSTKFTAVSCVTAIVSNTNGRMICQFKECFFFFLIDLFPISVLFLHRPNIW